MNAHQQFVGFDEKQKIFFGQPAFVGVNGKDYFFRLFQLLLRKGSRQFKKRHQIVKGIILKV